MHFFNPAPVMALVEIVSGLASDPTVAECLYETAKAWGKTGAHPFYAGLHRQPRGPAVLRRKPAPAAGRRRRLPTLDALMREAGGFAMGAFELTDLIGHDVNYAVTCSVFDAYYGTPASCLH
jgi:3-hydroxybutyryl-CoA dehydrogenase